MIKTFHINSSFINKLSVRRALLLDSLPESLLAKFQFLWTGEYSGNNLLNDLGSDVITVTGKDWSTKYIPPNTTATFSVPNNATYISADGTDDFWFNSSDVLQQKNHADLIASTTMRTFIKYSDFDPYKVYAIGILKSGETLTSSEENIVSKFFKLWLFYFGTYSDYGYLKDNRTYCDGNA